MCGFGTYRKIDLFGELEEVIEEEAIEADDDES